MDKTSLIIPIYLANEELHEVTRDCLASLKYGLPDEVIVVDDGSPMALVYDGDYCNQLVVLPDNRGYAGAVNAGLARASGDILVISNNDILFTPDWLKALVLPLENGYDISSIRTTDNTGYATEDKITEGDKFGSLWAMRRAVYNSLGGLDEGYGRGYFEDTDYRRRALNAGLRIAKNHGHLVEHFGRATFDQVDPDREGYSENIKRFSEKWGFLE